MRHVELLEAERELAVGEGGVEEVDDARPDRQLGQPPAGHRVRRDDAVGAGQGQLLLGGRRARPGPPPGGRG